MPRVPGLRSVNRWTDAVQSAVRRRIDKALTHAHASIQVPRARLDAIETRLERLEDRTAHLATRLEDGLFSPTMTVAEAWKTLPGVRRVFASHSLTRCASCPVADDESLEEAARSHGFSVLELLVTLRSLVPPTPSRPSETQA